MKKIIFSFAMLIFVSIYTTNLFAQTPQYYNSNTGSVDNAFPFMMASGKAVNWLFLAGELNQPAPLPAGNAINKVYFRVGITGGTRTYTNLQILMAQSTITTLSSSAFYAGPWDTVYNHATTTLTGTSGVFMGIDLDHVFPYDPTKSLIIFVGQCGATNSGITIWQSSLSGVRRVWSTGGCPFTVYGGDGMTVDFGVDVTVVGINQFNPQSFSLSQNSPNPFNEYTLINYELPSNSDVVLKVYDVMGKEITTLVNANQTAGKYEVRFDAADLAPGLYVYQLTSNNFTQSKLMTIQK